MRWESHRAAFSLGNKADNTKKTWVNFREHFEGEVVRVMVFSGEDFFLCRSTLRHENYCIRKIGSIFSFLLDYSCIESTHVSHFPANDSKR